jgi:hypothetical protein
MSIDDSTHCTAEQGDVDEEELRRGYYDRLSDWSETSPKVNRDGKLLGTDQDEDEDTPASDWFLFGLLAKGPSVSLGDGGRLGSRQFRTPRRQVLVEFASWLSRHAFAIVPTLA